MNFQRTSGILLHPTSLPGRFGIGDLGSGAYHFADFLEGARQTLWQVLPLGPTGYGNSPYQCLSVFAGNPLLISLERLAEDGFLEPADLENIPPFPEHIIDYDAVINFKMPLLKKSFEIFERRGTSTERERFEVFCKQNASWLELYSLFMALKKAHGLTSWNAWEENIRRRQPEALEHWSKKLGNEIRGYKYQQFQFFKQWHELKKYCNERGIKLIGDIPIFVASDSAEVWSHPEMFYLDDSGRPMVISGLPPDYFSVTGQLWGTPLYRWDVAAKDGYGWWIERFRATLALVDIIRLDHFRGFAGYYEIPADHTTAENGRWVTGPAQDLFRAVDKYLGDGLITPGTGLPIIAEDLGMVTPDVIELLEAFDLPDGKKCGGPYFFEEADPAVKYTGIWKTAACAGTCSGDAQKYSGVNSG